ncbi:hypothetical protein [Jeotgalibacillus aurantiacus]|uniref:hypothetical protein n=1 Tax=Jeotgalibacillus aurantiacus TaxID=2763266 RepID=UPI001D0A6754|nr:hypothetical protein [Jeotgalibacillus aurantiacus]
MSKKRRKSSHDGWINFIFTLIYLSYWWFILQGVLQGFSQLIYISIVPFIILMFLHSLTTRWMERRVEKQLAASVEKSIARYKDRIRTGA